MNAADLVNTLGGQWDKGRRQGFVCCPCHADKTPSLKIKDGPDGNVILHCFAGCHWRDIKDELRQQGLLPPLDGKRDQTTNPRPQQSHTTQADASDQNVNIEIARRIWRDAVPASGTPVETYLQGRGIKVPIPPSIKYAPNLRHTPTGLTLPTMIAAVQSPDRRIMGIHRTYLRADGKAKVPFTRPKMMLGRCAQGAVRLAKAGPKLAVGEGLENCLSVSQETSFPVWAALSTSGVKTVILPSCVKEVILLSDGDEAGERAVKEASRRFRSEGRTVKIARPPKDMDFNDVLRSSQKTLSKVVLLDNYRNPDDGG